MSVGTRMKERRESLGLTQVQLANMLGVTKGAIGNYETDSNSPKAAILYKVFEVLKCDANYLFQDEIRDHAEYQATPAEMERLVKKYRSLDPYGKEAVDGILDVEWRRCRAEEEAQSIAPQEEASFVVVPFFRQPSSAGPGQPLNDERSEEIRLKKAPPKGTSYITIVSGRSMEPTYHDGDLIFVSGIPEIRRGQIPPSPPKSCPCSRNGYRGFPCAAMDSAGF